MNDLIALARAVQAFCNPLAVLFIHLYSIISCRCSISPIVCSANLASATCTANWGAILSISLISGRIRIIILLFFAFFQMCKIIVYLWINLHLLFLNRCFTTFYYSSIHLSRWVVEWEVQRGPLGQKLLLVLQTIGPYNGCAHGRFIEGQLVAALRLELLAMNAQLLTKLSSIKILWRTRVLLVLLLLREQLTHQSFALCGVVLSLLRWWLKLDLSGWPVGVLNRRDRSHFALCLASWRSLETALFSWWFLRLFYSQARLGRSPIESFLLL